MWEVWPLTVHAILGELHATMNVGKTHGKDFKHKEVHRQRCSVEYTHQGRLICGTVFRSLHGIGICVFLHKPCNIVRERVRVCVCGCVCV